MTEANVNDDSSVVILTFLPFQTVSFPSGSTSVVSTVMKHKTRSQSSLFNLRRASRPMNSTPYANAWISQEFGRMPLNVISLSNDKYLTLSNFTNDIKSASTAVVEVFICEENCNSCWKKMPYKSVQGLLERSSVKVIMKAENVS